MWYGVGHDVAHGVVHVNASLVVWRLRLVLFLKNARGTPEDARKRIAEIDKEFDEVKKRAQHFKNITTERQELQKLLETQERKQKVQQAKKQQKEIMKQINKELHKISQAQQTVIEALKKIEPQKWKLWNLQEQYHELKHMGFIIPTPVKKFALPDNILTAWAKL